MTQWKGKGKCISVFVMEKGGMVQGPSDLWAIEVAGGTIISYNFSLKKYCSCGDKH